MTFPHVVPALGATARGSDCGAATRVAAENTFGSDAWPDDSQTQGYSACSGDSLRQDCVLRRRRFSGDTGARSKGRRVCWSRATLASCSVLEPFCRRLHGPSHPPARMRHRHSPSSQQSGSVHAALLTPRDDHRRLGRVEIRTLQPITPSMRASVVLVKASELLSRSRRGEPT